MEEYSDEEFMRACCVPISISDAWMSLIEGKNNK
jgi:hypothetical protein